MKEIDTPIRDEAVTRYFSLWKGAQLPLSTFKGTVVEPVVETLVNDGKLISQRVMTQDGIDSIIYFPDFEMRREKYKDI